MKVRRRKSLSRKRRTNPRYRQQKDKVFRTWVERRAIEASKQWYNAMLGLLGGLGSGAFYTIARNHPLPMFRWVIVRVLIRAVLGGYDELRKCDSIDDRYYSCVIAVRSKREVRLQFVTCMEDQHSSSPVIALLMLCSDPGSLYNSAEHEKLVQAKNPFVYGQSNRESVETMGSVILD